MSESASGYAYTVVDTPSRVGRITSSVLGVARLAVIPCGLIPGELSAHGQDVSLVREATEHNARLEAMLLIRGRRYRETEYAEARRVAGERGLGIFVTQISKRTDSVTAMIGGLSVVEYPQCEAAREMRSLCGEILGTLHASS
jgi:cellulose biosynthesis protein BcsQ